MILTSWAWLGFYKGNWNSDSPSDSNATYCNIDNYCIIGSFDSNGPNYGVQNFSEGVYIGSFKNNSPNGIGRLEFNNGEIYEGPFENGNFQTNDIISTGTYTMPNGNTYKGEYNNDIPVGLHEVTYRNRNGRPGKTGKAQAILRKDGKSWDWQSIS